MSLSILSLQTASNGDGTENNGALESVLVGFSKKHAVHAIVLFLSSHSIRGGANAPFL